MKRSAGEIVDVPDAVITVTGTVPVPSGLERIIWEAVSLMKLVTCDWSEINSGGAGEVGAADRHQRAAHRRAARRADRRQGRFRCRAHDQGTAGAAAGVGRVTGEAGADGTGINARTDAGQDYAGQGRDAVGVGRCRTHRLDRAPLAQNEINSLAGERDRTCGQRAGQRGSPSDGPTT